MTELIKCPCEDAVRDAFGTGALEQAAVDGDSVEAPFISIELECKARPRHRQNDLYLFLMINFTRACDGTRAGVGIWSDHPRMPTESEFAVMAKECGIAAQMQAAGRRKYRERTGRYIEERPNG